MSHRFHGAPERFDEVADFIANAFGRKIKYIADVAGGQGKLTRILRKSYNYESEVIDPRGYTMVGVPSKQEEFDPEMASYYDLIVGLHPDEATKAIAQAALIRPTLLIPCCNFWDTTQKLNGKALVESLCDFYDQNDVEWELVQFDFKSDKNVGILSKPARAK